MAAAPPLVAAVDAAAGFTHLLAPVAVRRGLEGQGGQGAALRTIDDNPSVATDFAARLAAEEAAAAAAPGDDLGRAVACAAAAAAGDDLDCAVACAAAAAGTGPAGAAACRKA